MKKGKLIIGAILIVAVLYACLNTTTTPRTSSVTVNVQAGRTASLTVEPLNLAKRLSRILSAALSPPAANAYIPSIVAAVRLTVTAGDMTSIERTEPTTGLDSVSMTVDVPVGMNRNFLVQGLSSAGSVVFSGQVVADLTGAPLDIPITMTPGTMTIPQLLSTLPADGAANVAFRPAVSATFSEDLDGSTVTGRSLSFVQTATGSPVDGTISTAGATVTYTLSSDLLPNTDYTVTISTAVRSAYGIPLSRSIVWLFTTAPTVPVVIATSPAGGETGVPMNAVITVAFSEAMDPATVNAGTFMISGVTGTVSYNVPGRTATLTPAGLLASGTTYTATVTTGALSANNVPLALDHAWSFTTGAVSDTMPPLFGGLETAANLSLSSMELLWTAATDSFTPSANMVYLVYQAVSSGGQDYANPAFVTAPGAASAVISSLTPGTVYYFVVRARDEAGNIDANTIERSSSFPGLYVDAVNGNDDTGDGSSANPYRTITKALSVSTGSLGVYAATGTYSQAIGESFPLQLKPATTLYCRGADGSSVIDATGSGADAVYGNVNSIIDRCTVIPESGKGGIDDRIGGAGGTPAPITVSNSMISGPALDAVTLSANSSIATSTISGTGGRGVVISAGRPSVTGNRISDKQTAIVAAADTDPSIDGNTLENNGVGIMVTAAGGRPSVRNNTIANNVKGIEVTAGAPLIHKNEVRTNFIAGNDVGIEIAGGMPTISFNTVTNNDVGVAVTGGTPTVKSNSIYCNVIADLEVLNNTQIDARKNAWDHAPPVMDLAPCLGADICYAFDVTGIPVIDPYSPPPAGACP